VVDAAAVNPEPAVRSRVAAALVLADAGDRWRELFLAFLASVE
jgi:hypothetical protein